MADISSDIAGVDHLQDALRALSAALPGSLRDELTDSARMIVRGAQGRVPRRTGAARASLDVSATETGTEIVAGGRRAPYYGWLDFGGRVGRRNRTLRPFVRDGRYLYPAAVAGLEDIRLAAERAVVEAGSRAGVTVHDG